MKTTAADTLVLLPSCSRFGNPHTLIPDHTCIVRGAAVCEHRDLTTQISTPLRSRALVQWRSLTVAIEVRLGCFQLIKHCLAAAQMSTMAPQEDYQKIFHWAETQKDGSIPSFSLRDNDPYDYSPGFNNHFESEAIPGTIPRGQNSPRNVRYGLYAEQITGSAFVAPRHVNKKAWLYRSRPAVAHQGFVSLVAAISHIFLALY